METLQESFVEYKERFMLQRKALLTQLIRENRYHSSLQMLQEEWLTKAKKTLDDTAIDFFITQINYATCKTHEAVLEICMQIELKVGSNPLMYAFKLTRLAQNKLYLTELLNKVRTNK